MYVLQQAKASICCHARVKRTKGIYIYISDLADFRSASATLWPMWEKWIGKIPFLAFYYYFHCYYYYYYSYTRGLTLTWVVWNGKILTLVSNIVWWLGTKASTIIVKAPTTSFQTYSLRRNYLFLFIFEINIFLKVKLAMGLRNLKMGTVLECIEMSLTRIQFRLFFNNNKKFPENFLKIWPFLHFSIRF